MRVSLNMFDEFARDSGQRRPIPYSQAPGRASSWRLRCLIRTGEQVHHRPARQSPIVLILTSLWLAILFYVRLPALSQQAGNHGASDREGLPPILISYIPTGSPLSVHVAGTFNGWNTKATPLIRQPNSLAWSVTLHLQPGVYQYRIVVNGNRWLTPQDAPRWNDGNGNSNALLLVAPRDFANHSSQAGDGQITASAVFHEATKAAPISTVRNVRYVVRMDSRHFALTLRTRHNDVQACYIKTSDSRRSITVTDHLTSTIPMKRYASDALFDYWHGIVAVPPNGAAVQYAFLLQDGKTVRRYDSSELLSSLASSTLWFQVKPMDFPPFETPDWARDAIFYQIFPDRFADGDPANDPADVQRWDAKPSAFNRMGGDLAGILSHFEYLRELGVNALYLNPIFEARSNHGYDTTDYKKVDPRFGTTGTLKSLTARAHLHGWHVLLDGVFNHTGVDFAGFKSLQEEGRNSKYRNWYFVHGFPVEVKEGQKNYEGWNGTPWMPKLNVSNPATQDYLLDIGTYWIKEAQIDGWRLDAANEINHDFLKAFRKAVKETKPDAFIVGEIWPDASDWLQGDEVDSVMNYRWRGAALDFFVFDKTPPTKFDAALSRIRSDYPPAATAVMFNMLDSHDVERIRTLCKGNWAKQQQAVLFQMTYPGTPCIYYGDEIGMEGGRDPDNRRAMEWDETKWDKTTLGFYKQVIGLRKQHAVLRRGDFQTVLADDKAAAYAYLRSFNNERALVVFNRGDNPQTVALPIAKVGSLPFHDWLNSGAKVERKGENLMVNLPKRGFIVLGH